MNVKYCGPALDYSGYGEANRHDIAALVSAGIQVTTEIPRYTPEIADFGNLGALAASLEGKKLDYQVKIMHTTPNVYGQYHEPGKYHIGRVFWETDKLPDDFVRGINFVDEIWTGSEFNAAALKNSGVSKPIYIIPEAIETPAPKANPYIVYQKDTIKFYSIFEWTERKNPNALLTAYLTEFSADDNVSLTIKTYVDNFDPRHREEITIAIRKLKDRLGLAKYPPIYLYRALMTRHQIYRFHATFDVFVSAHRGEGWGIPQMEAMLMGNPIISTNCGGIHEYLGQNEAFLVPYKLIPLVENSRNRIWYTSDQKWADIETSDMSKWMRWVYENQKQAKEIGKNARAKVEQVFSINAVGQKMLARLEEI